MRVCMWLSWHWPETSHAWTGLQLNIYVHLTTGLSCECACEYHVILSSLPDLKLLIMTKCNDNDTITSAHARTCWQNTNMHNTEPVTATICNIEYTINNTYRWHQRSPTVDVTVEWNAGKLTLHMHIHRTDTQNWYTELTVFIAWELSPPIAVRNGRKQKIAQKGEKNKDRKLSMPLT